MDECCDYIEQVGEGLEQKQDEIIRRLESLNRLMADAIAKSKANMAQDEIERQKDIELRRQIENKPSNYHTFQ